MTKRELRTKVKEIMDADDMSIPTAAKQMGVHFNTLGNFLRYLSGNNRSLALILKWRTQKELDRSTIHVPPAKEGAK